MEILIQDERKVKEIMQEFNEGFPYLKLEFFSMYHRKGELSPKDQLIAHEAVLGQIRKKHNSGTINLDASKSVTQVESEFAEDFGLFVQVFRRSGNVWIGTSITDGWSLATQNNEGYEITHGIPLHKYSAVESIDTREKE